MDSALWELYESGSANDEVSVILRLGPEARVPPNVRVVSEFGTIVTARVRRGEIRRTWLNDDIVSMKAPRPLTHPSPLEADDVGDDGEAWGAPESYAPPLPDVPEDGRGVVVGLCDWGLDFTHANFRNADGTTRLLALWDQRGEGGSTPEPFRYGRGHTRGEIDAALRAVDPCAALGYDVSRMDPRGQGMHGTHVADILAGNRREPGSVVGVARGADLVFVHLGRDPLPGLANFGDSVQLLEGVDFIRRIAGDRPCVMHLSAGKTGGSHEGDTPFERAIDQMLLSRPGTALVQSAGNYADASLHTHARIGPDQRHEIVWVVSRRDRTANELEVWYSGEDVLDLTLISPTGERFHVPLGERRRLRQGGAEWGSLYHRRREPNSGRNHIDIFLRTTAPPGRWRVVLRGIEIVDGRVHAWIERDARGAHQSRILRSQATSIYTTNTICNGLRTIAVGAYDASRDERPATRFSSRGPTADGRQKPELVAPGYRITAARSMPPGGWSGQSRFTVKSGTSMAAPWVSGTVALMFQAAGRPLTIHETRSILIGTVEPHGGPAGRSSTKLGYGYLNPAAAVAAARRLGAQLPSPRPGTAALAVQRASTPDVAAPRAVPPVDARARSQARAADRAPAAVPTLIALPRAELQSVEEARALVPETLDEDVDEVAWLHPAAESADEGDEDVALEDLHEALLEFSSEDLEINGTRDA